MAYFGLRYTGVRRLCSTSKYARFCFSTTTLRTHARQYTSGVRTNVQSESHIFKISPKVQDALLSGKPVVALESTIYTHGFPYPDNVALAQDLEAVVYSNGGTPATIGIVGGVATVGLSSFELIELASSAGNPETMKVSRRDLPYILGMGLSGRRINGGTTISGTMFLAQKAGIKVFGTGGLGGVHRGGEDTMDISADLTELGRTPVAVISSGCKSFLDIPRTLEYLETQGAGVYTFADGRTGSIDFPAFYTRDSGVKGPMVVQNAREAAAIIYSQSIFEKSSGLLFGNPIPERFSIPKAEIDIAINQAVQEAAEQGIHGHANTPFILARIKDLTKGRSIPANRALIESNVTMATKVAVELAALSMPLEKVGKHIYLGEKFSPRAVQPPTKETPITPLTSSGADILVFGSVAVDYSCDYIPYKKLVEPFTPQLQTSNPSSIVTSVGGVGHNVALAIHRTAASTNGVRLGSLVGDDLAGKVILSTMGEDGLDTSGISQGSKGVRTAQYVAVNDGNKDLVLAMADMDIYTGTQAGEYVSNYEDVTQNVKWAVVDANWEHTIAWQLMSKLSSKGAQIAFEPVSVAKSAAVFTSPKPGSHPLGIFPTNKIDLVTPNHHELAAMHTAAKEHGYFETQRWWRIIDALGIPSSGARDRFVALTSRKMTDEGVPLQTIQLLPLMPTILTKLGAEGVLLTKLLKPGDPRLTDPEEAPYILSRCANGTFEVGGVYMRLFPVVEKVEDVVSVNGVGDTFLGVLIAGLARGLKLDETLINIAQEGAVMTLRSQESVSPELSSLRSKLDSHARSVGGKA